MRSCLKKIISVNKPALNSAKKSFTLVELSIVLLILSLLVGSLLTGRQLVERAEINKIISEIDYYQKNVLQFQDTFQFLPGNMDEDNCNKNTILYKTFYETAKSHPNASFHSLATTTYTNVDDYCKDKSHTVNGFVGLPYFASYQSYVSIYQAVAQMAQAGLIKSDAIVQNKSGLSDSQWESGPLLIDPSFAVSVDSKFLQPTSFNEDGLIMFAGFDIFANDSASCSISGNVADINCGNSRTLNFIRGSASYDGVQTELHDTTFAKALDRKNAVVMFYNDTSTTFTKVSDNSSGIVSPSQMNKIDQKMDDGRPGTGRVLALKSGLGRSNKIDPNTNEPVSKSVCYNDLATNVSNAYYLNSDDAIYGCNIVAVIQR